MFNTYNGNDKKINIITEIPYFCERYFNDNNKKCKEFYGKILSVDKADEFYQCPYGFSCYKSNKRIYTSLIVKKHSELQKIKIHLNDYKQNFNNFSEYTIEQIRNLIKQAEKLEETNEIYSVTIHDIKNATKALLDLTDTFGTNENLQAVIKSNDELYTTIEGYGLIKYRLDYHDLILGEGQKIDNQKCNIVLHKMLRKLSIQLEYRAKKKDVKLQIKGNPTNIFYQHTALYLGYFILLENAIKYANSGSQIEIQIVDTNSSETVVTITNLCKTIYADEITQLGVKGFRSQNAKLTSNGSGLGLGLAKTIFNDANISLTINYTPITTEMGKFEVRTIVTNLQ